MQLRSHMVLLRRMKLVHESRSGWLCLKLVEYQSRSLSHRSHVRKVQLFTHCSPKNFIPYNFVVTKRDPTAYKNQVIYQCWQLGGVSCNLTIWHRKRNPQVVLTCHLDGDKIHPRSQHLQMPHVQDIIN